MRKNEFKLRQGEIRVKLTLEKENLIKALLDKGVTPKAIKIMYGIPYSQIHEIRKKK